MELVFTLISSALGIGVAYGLAYWAFRAESDRSASVGLVLVYGFPGILLVVAGAALLIYGRDWGPMLLGVGLGLTLPLWSRFRFMLARVTPIDPQSPTDMSGLCILLGIFGLLAALAITAPEPDDVEGSVGIGLLIAQLLVYVGLSYAVVGVGFRRTFRQCTERLGVWMPSFRIIAISVGCVLLGFFVSGFGSALTAIFQPDVSDQIQESLKDLTAEVQNPIGAAILGISAGVGEELLFRGALQPRYGIVLTAAVFALLHNNYGLSFIMLGVFGLGVLLGIQRMRYGTVSAMITHAIFNMIAVLAQSAT